MTVAPTATVSAAARRPPRRAPQPFAMVHRHRPSAFVHPCMAARPAATSSSSSSSSAGALCALSDAVRHAACAVALSSAMVLLPFSPSLSPALPPVALADTVAAVDVDDTEHRFVHEVWTIIDTYYHDAPALIAASWDSELSRLDSTPLRNHDITYARLSRSLSLLHDPYTRLLPPERMASLRKFDVSGIGVLAAVSDAGDFTVSSDPPKGSPAAAAGMAAGDVIEAVDGRATAGADAFEVAGWMQGADGSPITLTVRGRGDITLKRSFTNPGAPPVSRTVVLEQDGERVGYIKLAEFTASGRNDVAAAMREVRAAGADWLILDLRGNGGGVFEGALEIGALLAGDNTPMVSVSARSAAASSSSSSSSKTSDMPQQMYRARLVGSSAADVWSDVDVAVLVDSRSASSSEVLAAGLRDNCRAALVGNERTFGKGRIQGVFGLSDGGGAVVTVGRYRTPAGEDIDKVGLQPDLPLPPRDGVTRFLAAVGVRDNTEHGFRLAHDDVRDVLRMCRDRQLQ